MVVKKKLGEIGTLFLKYNELYNNYKHGFRIAIITTGNPEIEDLCAATMWPIKKGLEANKAMNKAMIMRIENTEQEIQLCGFMCQVLHETAETFRLRVLEKKQEFKVVAFKDQT